MNQQRRKPPGKGSPITCLLRHAANDSAALTILLRMRGGSLSLNPTLELIVSGGGGVICLKTLTGRLDDRGLQVPGFTIPWAALR